MSKISLAKKFNPLAAELATLQVITVTGGLLGTALILLSVQSLYTVDPPSSLESVILLTLGILILVVAAPYFLVWMLRWLFTENDA